MSTSAEETAAAMTFVTTNTTGSSGGTQGLAGKDGRDGRDGKDGAVGLMGPQGPKGDDGRDGMDGPRGKDGMVGAVGAVGAVGTVGTVGAVGSKGDTGADGSQGSQGHLGPIGARGDDGRDGMDGSNGRPGPVGEKGPKGDSGPMGSMGATGSKGDTGADGSQGTQGTQGSQGHHGPIGSRGDDGRDGMDGSNGRPGPVGEKGPKGDNGPIGPMGPNGDIGPAGTPGTLVGGQVNQLSVGIHVNPGNFVPPLFVSKKDYVEDYDDTNETISNTINSWYTNQTSALYLNSNPNSSRDIPINNGPTHISSQPIDGISIVSAGTIITEAIVLASDERIKHQISPLESSTHMLDKLVPVTYLLRADHPGAIPHHGFIAQNVKEAIPGSVTESPNWVPSVSRWCDVLEAGVRMGGNGSNGSNVVVGTDIVSEFTTLLSHQPVVRLRVCSANGGFTYYSCDSVVSEDTIHIVEPVTDSQPYDLSGNPLLKYNSGLMRLIVGSDSIPEHVIPVMGANGTWAGEVEPFIGAVKSYKIFVWGHEVMDFHSVDMMAIISILTDSVKRLSAEVAELKR